MAQDEVTKLLEEVSRLFVEGENGEALESCDKALALDPKNAWDWAGRGLALGQLGRYQEAVGSYDKALELEPGFAEAWTAKNEALDRLEEWLKQRRPPHPCVELFNLVAPAEKRLHLFIQQRLQQAFGKSEAEWWVKGVPEKIRTDCVTRWEQNLRREATAYNYIFLIDLKVILDKNWLLFEPDFQRVKGQFKSKKEFLDGITRLNEIRNAVMHPMRSVPSEEEQAFARQLCQVIQDFTNTG